MAYPYTKNQNMKSVGPDTPKTPGLQPVKTDGRIGSVTPPSWLKGGYTVDNNKKAGPHAEMGALAASHMSPAPRGETWSPRVAKARAMAKPYPREHGHPVNTKSKTLKPVKPT